MPGYSSDLPYYGEPRQGRRGENLVLPEISVEHLKLARYRWHLTQSLLFSVERGKPVEVRLR
jgi:hypothetical protein